MKNRLKEPSTWAAIGILIQIGKGFLPPHWGAVLDSASVLAATVAGVAPEGSAQ